MIYLTYNRLLQEELETLVFQKEVMFTIGAFGQQDRPLITMKLQLVALTASSERNLFLHGNPS